MSLSLLSLFKAHLPTRTRVQHCSPCQLELGITADQGQSETSQGNKATQCCKVSVQTHKARSQVLIFWVLASSVAFIQATTELQFHRPFVESGKDGESLEEEMWCPSNEPILCPPHVTLEPEADKKLRGSSSCQMGCQGSHPKPLQPTPTTLPQLCLQYILHKLHTGKRASKS